MFYLVFIFGMIAGSFLNVVIYRLNPALKLKGGVFGRSMCPNCKTQLKWYDLVPILSFFWLKRRCRYCLKKISWQYPVVEILSGLIWVLVFWKVFGFNFFPAQYKLNIGYFNILKKQDKPIIRLFLFFFNTQPQRKKIRKN